MNKRIPIGFMILAASVLLFGCFMGILGATQYLDPSFLKESLPFNQLRGIHVSSMISWIILCATGGIYYYISIELGNKLFSDKLAMFHLLVFAMTGFGIYVSLFTGKMGGREYLTFYPVLMIPILLGWVLFGINYFKTLLKQVKGWPVYLWMWGTGIVFMVFHLCEANFWVFDFFRENYIRDLSVQWKSYGSFTGCWNLLVYGTAIFLMVRIKGDENIARSKIAFFFYFLGLANLMFGWAHHIYPVPSKSWIRLLAYGTSMTEWIVLGYMLTQWMRSLNKKEKENNLLAYRMLVITDIWVFMNVLIAVIISIPVVNHFTHGSHITVAHSMGTTIGINTPILLASFMFFLSRIRKGAVQNNRKIISMGMVLFNASLVFFLTSLIIAGVVKGQWMYSEESNAYGVLTAKITPYLRLFLYSGYGIFISLILMVAPLLRGLLENIKPSEIEYPSDASDSSEKVEPLIAQKH